MKTKLQRLEKILEFSQELTSTVSLGPLLHMIIEAATELTDSDLASILLSNEPTGELHFLVASSFEDQLVKIPVPIDGSIAGAAFSSGEAVIVPNVHADPRYYKKVEQEVGVKAHSLLAVPLQFKDRRIGVLEAENKRNGEVFNQNDVETLTLLATQATIAIENARMVEDLDKARDVLEQRVTERTAELSTANQALKKEIAQRVRAEESLRQHAVELEARNEELDTFAHTVAHDLRNPLSTIISYAELLAAKYADLPEEKLARFLGTMARVGRKMNTIIEEMMLLAGVRQMEVQPDPLDMASIVAEVQTRLADMIKENQVEVELPEQWPEVVGYGPWVEEVWVNYLSNAIKYGGEPLRVKLGATMQPNGMVSFWVRDNGAGISPEKQAKLFMPFQRLDQVRIEGHGLGLSIVRRIVEKLGGQVGVESDGIPDRGSTFFFTLPVTR